MSKNDFQLTSAGLEKDEIWTCPLEKLKIEACKDSHSLCMHDQKALSLSWYFKIMPGLTNPRRVEKQSVL